MEKIIRTGSLVHNKIVHRDTTYRLRLVAVEIYGIGRRRLCRHIIYSKAGIPRRQVAPAITEIVRLETQYGSCHIADGNGIDKHIFYISATVEVGLEEQGVLHIADFNACHIHAFHSARHLASDTQSVAFAEETAVAYHDILGRTTNASPVGVTPRLYGYGIVACKEGAVPNPKSDGFTPNFSILLYSIL